MVKIKAFIYGKLGVAFMLAFMGLLLGGAAKLFSQSVFWLRNGYWQSYSISNLLHDLEIGVPRTPSLLGLQKIIDDVLSWPALILLAALAIASLIVGSIFIALGEANEWTIQKQADERLRAQRAHEDQKERQEVAMQSKRDFDFGKQVDDIVRRRDY
jgi:hypothetical protein